MVKDKFGVQAGPQSLILSGLSDANIAVSEDEFAFIDHSASHVAKKESYADYATALAGTSSATGLVAAAGVLAVDITDLDSKTTPIAADSFMINDSADTNKLKEVSFTQAAKPLTTVMAGVAATTGLTESAGVLTVAAKIAHLEAALLKGITVVPMSFDANEQTTTKIYFNSKVTINKIRGIVVKAVAASDNGTVTAADSTGNMTSGVITAVAADALNTAYIVSPSDHNVIAADSYVQLTSVKSTAGGKLLVTLEWTRTA